jgi:cell division protein FtsW (lipid II flippase)
MKNKKIIYWLPRISSIAFVLFLSLFALDVFEEYSGWQAVLGFLMHLLPSFVLLAVILIAWKYDLVGAIAFLASAAFYVFMAGFDRPWSWYAGISGPAAVVGILFLLSWLQKRKNKVL